MTINVRLRVNIRRFRQTIQNNDDDDDDDDDDVYAQGPYRYAARMRARATRMRVARPSAGKIVARRVGRGNAECHGEEQRARFPSELRFSVKADLHARLIGNSD